MPDIKPTLDLSKHESVLEEVSNQESIMKKAVALQSIAASFGFDWPDIEPVFEKLNEEIHELKHEVACSRIADADLSVSKKRLEDELGDVLFCCMNLARFLEVNPEKALQSTNDKFKRRFSFIESYAAQEGRNMQDLSLEELDKIWDLAKAKGL